MAINKVEYNGTTLIDLTGNTVTADKLMAGETATDRSGEQITGTVVDSGHAWQDSDGYVHLDDDVGTKADVSDTTATPSTVLDGEIFYTSAGVRSVGTVTVPTKLSDLTNDLVVSDFQNDAGYLTSYTETDPNISAWARASSKPSYTASEVGAVPTTRTVNGKALSSNITLTASDVSALPSSTSIPSKVSDLTNDAGYITGYTETDPTVPSWAKASSKPSYTASEVGAVPTSRTVNGKALSSNISLTASDVGAVATETDPVFSASASAGITSTDISNWDNGLIEFNDSASSGDDYNLATALTALGWLSDVVV